MVVLGGGLLFLGPLGFDFAQHRQTLRPSVDGIRSKALRSDSDQQVLTEELSLSLQR